MEYRSPHKQSNTETGYKALEDRAQGDQAFVQSKHHEILLIRGPRASDSWYRKRVMATVAVGGSGSYCFTGRELLFGKNKTNRALETSAKFSVMRASDCTTKVVIQSET